MRISTKLTLGSGLVGLAVFGGLGALQIATEKHDLEDAALRDTSVLCRAVAESIRQDVEQGEPISDALTRALEQLDTRLDVVLWRGETPAPLGRQELHTPRAFVEDLALRSLRTSTVASDIVPAADRRLAGVAAAVVTGGPDAVVVVRPLDDVDADIAEEVELVTLAVVGFSLLSGLLGFSLGQIYVERPLARLDRAMARVGRGDHVPELGPGRDDEIGRVLRRFDEMAGELTAARDRLHDEQAAHRDALARLRDADRLVTVGQLSAGLAHEIGSPLQVLLSRARKLERVADDPAEVTHAATIIVAQLDRITRVVRQLLQFAVPRTPELHMADPEATVRAVVDLLELEARRKPARITVTANASGRASIDADALQQIVLNLARNALTAVEPGGAIDIELTRRRGEPDADAPDGRPRLHLVVVDNGRGISQDVQRRMFEPFFTTRAPNGGIGLGLAVVKSLVDGLHGTVTVDTPPTGGTRFEVVLPC